MNPRSYVALGALCGLAWAAGFRGWMIQMAGPAESRMTWYATFGLILLPGTLVGAAFGLAEHRRRTGGAFSRPLALAPLLFLAALAVPWIFRALFASGQGGGAIGIALFGLAGGYAGSGRGRAWWRRTCGTFAVLGTLLMLTMASDTAPLGDPYGAWVGLLAASLVAVFCLACSIPWRVGSVGPLDRSRAGVRIALVGALAGLGWTCARRAFMSEVAGDERG